MAGVLAQGGGQEGEGPGTGREEVAGARGGGCLRCAERGQPLAVTVVAYSTVQGRGTG